ncbi:hypothetical protein CH267_02690 [Rhodococcus sp. 06-621-2]|nr:hypothetical protein CH267_02690 [Rhodococcus sp. 06-621-2]
MSLTGSPGAVFRQAPVRGAWQVAEWTRRLPNRNLFETVDLDGAGSSSGKRPKFRSRSTLAGTYS